MSNFMDEFRLQLEKNYTQNTADRYYFAVKKLFDSISIPAMRKLPHEEIEKRLVNIRTKDKFSAAKNGLLQLKLIIPDIDIPSMEYFKQESRKRKNKVQRGEELYFDEIRRKINQISDPKLKLAYRLMLISGARVSEVAALEKKDFLFEEGGLCLTIRNGKGGKTGVIHCRKDVYVEEKLQEYLINQKYQDQLFYSAGHMKNKAVELGIQCHDLRRIFAMKKMGEEKIAGKKTKDAENEVKEDLRHSKSTTTQLYLHGKRLKERRESDESGT